MATLWGKKVNKPYLDNMLQQIARESTQLFLGLFDFSPNLAIFLWGKKVNKPYLDNMLQQIARESTQLFLGLFDFSPN
jgi:hypothetical protein